MRGEHRCRATIINLLRRRVTGDAGYTVPDFAVCVVILMLIAFAGFELAMVGHARHVAQAAAEDVLNVAADYGSDAAAGRAEGYAYLRQVAGHLLHDPTVQVTRTGTLITVTVTGTVAAPLHVRVSAHASGPVEALPGTG